MHRFKQGECVRVCVGWENIARSYNQSDHKIVTHRPFMHWEKKESNDKLLTG